MRIFSKETEVIAALQQEHLKWLGNIPLDKLRELRERGEIADLRELLERNIRLVENCGDDEFLDLGLQVRNNIEKALEKHSLEVFEIQKKFKRMVKFGGAEGASLIVSGTLGIVGSAYPPLALTAGLAAGVPLAIHTYADYVDYRDKSDELKKKPVALLFDAKYAEAAIAPSST
jgi:hypothetical protein